MTIRKLEPIATLSPDADQVMRLYLEKPSQTNVETLLSNLSDPDVPNKNEHIV